MKIQCENCGKKYKFDEGKIKGQSVKLKCRACKNILVVEKPATQTEDLIDIGSIEVSPQADGPDFDSSAPYDNKIVEKTVEGPGVETKFAPKKIRFGLFFKIVILMLIVSLFPLLAYLAITFNKTSNLVRENTESFMDQTSVGLSNQVDEWIDNNIRVLKAAAGLSEILSMDLYFQEPALKAIQKEYPWMYLVFTVNLNGLNTARSDGKPMENYSDQKFFDDVVEKEKALSWQTIIGKTSKKPALVLAVPIISAGRIVGIMAAAANIDDISKNVALWRRGKTGFAFLVDENGKVISHRNKKFVAQQKNMNGHPMVQAYRRAKKVQTVTFKDERGREVFGHVRGNRYGWVLVIRQESEEVLKPQRDVQLFFYVLLIVTIFIVSIVAWFFARALVKPITMLTDIAERMSLGELDNKVNVKAKDEIGHLALAIERMRISLNMAMARLRKKR
ncbi:MAG: HAMP domain-containing protein [Deltaproteobacteria bacterium]|nr:HAMP domain-containing protein [Deltaproteobacteria bacterium]